MVFSTVSLSVSGIFSHELWERYNSNNLVARHGKHGAAFDDLQLGDSHLETCRRRVP